MDYKSKNNMLLIFLVVRSIVEFSILQWHNKYANDVFYCTLIINILSFIIIVMIDKDSVVNAKINIQINLLLFIVTLLLVVAESTFIWFIKEQNIGNIFVVILYVLYFFMIVVQGVCLKNKFSNCNDNVILVLHIVSICSCLSYLINQIHMFYKTIDDIYLMILRSMIIYVSIIVLFFLLRYIRKVEKFVN